tara:strand:- start:515 stop:730 length:216 start_codon:yes stop_codon:yes gene_type:complete
MNEYNLKYIRRRLKSFVISDNKKERKMSNTWAWVYGDECDFLWEHFGMPDRNSNDRIKVKLVDFEEEPEDD